MGIKANLKDKLYKLVFSQTIPQEIANSITHGIGALLSIAAIVILVLYSSFSGSTLKVISFTIFGSTLFLMFISSTLYHALRPYKAKALFLKFDHITIYFLIAGTYTPILLITIGDILGWIIFILVWIFAITGAFIKILLPEASGKRISVGIYISMGWIVLFFMKVLLQKLPLGGIILLLSGGVVYTAGTLFFLCRKLYYSHAIWHLFVIAAATCHFFCVLFYI